MTPLCDIQYMDSNINFNMSEVMSGSGCSDFI